MSNFYSLDEIKKRDAQYYVIYGERSYGKTYAVLGEGLGKYFINGEQIAIIRRWHEDFVGANSAKTCFNSLMYNANGENIVKKLSKGEYDGIDYYGGMWFLTKYDEKQNKSIRTDKIVAYAFSLTGSEHYKSGSFPHITTILFDEFITRNGYLPDEFILFQNVISTIVRQRDNVKIYMCGNSVNKYGCPYFKEMGLYRVKDMQPGTIDVYEYGTTGLKVAVEYTGGKKPTKKSDVLFAFNNPKLDMIKNGKWEIDVYPHCPVKYKPKDILFIYTIIYDDQKLTGEIIQTDKELFTFIHRKTTPIKDEDNDLIYTVEYNPKPNYKRNILRPRSDIENKVTWFFTNDKVFYQDNEVGEIVRNYLQFCKGN